MTSTSVARPLALDRPPAALATREGCLCHLCCASGFTEKELRDAAARHYTPENLAAANTRVLERLRLLPHRWILDEQLTSSDGQRFETIGKSAIAGYAARYAGYRKRMLTWLLWLTGQYGHFGGKVIPVTERESWHTLDALVLLDSPSIQHTSDTHGATELVFAIFDPSRLGLRAAHG